MVPLVPFSGNRRCAAAFGAVRFSVCRACLIIGDMPNSEEFFCQTRQIFAGILTDGKKIERCMAEKGPLFGRVDIFQTNPNVANAPFSNSLLKCQIVSVYKLNYNNHPVLYNSKFQIDMIFVVCASFLDNLRRNTQ